MFGETKLFFFIPSQARDPYDLEFFYIPSAARDLYNLQ